MAIVLESHCYDIRSAANALPFGDVDPSSWQARVVSRALAEGIAAGDVDAAGNRVFRPNDTISKIEAFAIIVNLKTIERASEATVSPYTDIAAEWQNKYLNIGVGTGILNPAATNNMFMPNQKLSRDVLVGLLFDVMNTYTPTTLN